MSDTTERPPAREVLANTLAQHPDYVMPYHYNKAEELLTALAAAGYPVEAMHAQLADIEEHGTAEINHAVALRGLLVEAIGLLRVIGDAADGPAGQKFPVTVQNGRHLTATHVAKCAALVDRARDAVSTTPPSVAAGPALVEALEAENARLRGALKAPGLYQPTDETPEAVAVRHLKGVDQDPPLQPAEEPGP